jgi:hypothetical protein
MDGCLSVAGGGKGVTATNAPFVRRKNLIQT